ncbi:MAG: DUF7347 domain-containing protein [Candidatus Hodarchaeales archaeon]
MMSRNTAKLLTNVSHPIRINIIRILHATPKSFSEILKLLSLESTSKLSFHLESLAPLIEKDKDANYVLTPQGVSIHSFLDSVEFDSIIANIVPKLEIAPKEEKTEQKVTVLSQLYRLPLFFHLSLLIILALLYYGLLVMQNFDFLSFLEPFAQALFVILFLLPISFFMHHLHYCLRNRRSFTFLTLGMFSYVIFYPLCLLFLEQFHYLLKALLNFPEWSVSYDYITQSVVYSEWFYYPGNLEEILSEFGKTILFNDYIHDIRVIQALNLPRTIFWLVICCFFLLFISSISILVKWSWGSSPRHSSTLLSDKLRFIEDGRLWGILIAIYFVLSVFFFKLFDITTQDELPQALFSFSEYLLPSYMHLFPLFPSLLISLLIFYSNLSEDMPSRTKKQTLIFMIMFAPIIYWGLSIMDYLHLSTLTSSTISFNYLLSHLITGCTQLLALTGLAVLQMNLGRRIRRRDTI